jgi:hypothetical protein
MNFKSKKIEIYYGIIGSLDNKKNKGFSARKITAVAVNLCFVITHVVWWKHAFLREDFKHLVTVLVIEALYVLLLLGIITMQEVISLKNGDKTKEDEGK